jgi:hypothetical protein
MTKKTIIFVLAILAVVGVAGYFAFNKNTAEKKPGQQNNETADNQPQTKPTLEEIFGLDKKEAGTKLYYSEKLGVGFTYLDYASKTPVTVAEKDNKISVDNQTIEVFEKDPAVSLEQAIKDKFLQNYKPADCFVKIREISEQKLATYVAASISYPPAANPEDPFWKNSEKCPQLYSETNGMQYFLMNKEAPDRFLFVKIGQYSAASDGTPRTEIIGSNWTASIRILPLEDKNIEYKNTEYGFSFSLPESWQGYSIITDKWEGQMVKATNSTTVTGPKILIRHPAWTSANPRQDIPIMIFTPDQWALIQQEKLAIGAAPIGPSELGRNTQYIFALPARYNYAFPIGYEEVAKILEGQPLKAF